MEGDSQAPGPGDIGGFRSVMNNGSKQGNPKGADDGGLSNTNYKKGSIESSVKSSKGGNINKNSTLDCNYTKR